MKIQMRKQRGGRERKREGRREAERERCVELRKWGGQSQKETETFGDR